MARKEFANLEYRSDVLKFHRVMERIRENVRESHVELFRRTPFWGLFSSYHGGLIIEDAHRKSHIDIVSVLKCFDKGENAFVFGEITARITETDISKLFGLPCDGEVINLHQKKNKLGNGFIERRLGGYKTISKRLLEDQILKVVNLHGSVEESDFVRLVCLYFCVTLFFCNSGNNLMKNMIGYVEDLDKMPTYAWAIAAKEYLQNSLLNMNSVESACGCVVSLLFWVCECTQLINPINGREQSFPNFVKWNLLELHARMKTQPLHALKSMEPNKETRPKMPIKVNQSLEIKTNSGGKTVEPHKTSVNEFDHSKMFQLLPTQMMDCNQESSPKTPTKGNQTMEMGISSGGKTVASHKTSVVEFDPSKMFQLLPTQLMDCNQEGPSNSKVDIYDMERRLEELNAMLDAERSRNQVLSMENEKLKTELDLLKKGNKNDKSPEQRSLIVRMKARTRQALIRPEYNYEDIKGKAKCKKLKVDDGDTNNVEHQPKKVQPKKDVSHTVQTVAVRRLRVGKCLSLHDADILKKYLDANSLLDALWHGIHSTVYRKDALDLLHEEYISIQAMESYLEILNGDQMNLPRGHLKSCFMPTFGWELVNCGNTFGKKAVYLQDLLKKMRYNDLVFFPIIHVKQEHFTLLVFNKQSGWWEFYNTLQPKGSSVADPYVDEAFKLHVEITNHFQYTKSSVDTMLQTNEIWKYVMRRGEVVTQQCNLSASDRDLLMWLRSNSVDYPIRSSINCPQQDPRSFDCGVAVMYIMKTLSEGKALDPVFLPGAMKNMRAHVLGRFINDDECSWDAYKIN